MDMRSWLVGIIDGEGCFQITDQGIPVLTVMVSNRDRDLVEKCQAAAGGVGVVKHYPDAPHVPVSCWNVKAKSDLVKLVALLDATPLQGKKAVEYAIWREAVNVYRRRRAGGNHAARRAHNEPLSAQLACLRQKIRALR